MSKKSDLSMLDLELLDLFNRSLTFDGLFKVNYYFVLFNNVYSQSTKQIDDEQQFLFEQNLAVGCHSLLKSIRPENEAQVELSFDASSHSVGVVASFYHFDLHPSDPFAGVTLRFQLSFENNAQLECIIDATRHLCLSIDSLETLDQWTTALSAALGGEQMRVASNDDPTFYTTFELAEFRRSLQSNIQMVDDDDDDDNSNNNVKSKPESQILW
jgi:hypothetical protein